MFVTRIQKFIKEIYNSRELLLELAKRDFQKQYMGTYLGFIWVYLQPLLFISVLYLIFTLGFKAESGSDSIPFVVYLVVGIIPWFYIANNLGAMANVISQNSFLLKKVDFRLSLLPIVKIMSSFIPHLFFVSIAFIVAYVNGITPSLYAFELIYYYFCMISLLLGIGWLTSSTKIFVPDVSNFISLIITFGFWLTPIFWEVSKIPKEYQWIMNLNPAAYIVQGYRDSMISHIWFWEKPCETLLFWGFTIFILLIGITVFKRLRSHFAEVV